jgi:MFS transporter, DHA1 family, staphyloferrin A biosynthesis exporter
VDKNQVQSGTDGVTEMQRKQSRHSSLMRFRTVESFQFHDYRWLWLGTLFAFMAINMQQITRGWLILRLTDDSPLALSLVMMSFALPLTFASVFGGLMADRFPRKDMIVYCQSGNAVMTLLLATLDITGLIRFWHLMVIGFINGTLAAFNMPSRQSIVSDIVPPESLMNAISLNAAGMNLTRTIGPAVAGLLIIYLDTAGVFYLITGVHVFSAICMAMMRTGHAPAMRSGKGAIADIKEGFRYAMRNPTILGLVIMAFVPALFGFPYLALLPAWAREALNVRSDGLGLLMMFMGMGSLIGALILASFRQMRKRGAFLIANSLAWGISLAVFSQASSYAVALPLLLLIGLLSAIFMSLNMTLMQTYSSLEMRGRIVSMAMMTFGLMPLSAVPFGALAERIGTPDSLALSGMILTLASVGFFFAFRKFRGVE